MATGVKLEQHARSMLQQVLSVEDGFRFQVLAALRRRLVVSKYRL